MSKDPYVAVERMETFTSLLSAEVSRQVREQLEGDRSKENISLREMTPLQRRILLVLAEIEVDDEGTRAEIARKLGVKPQVILKALRVLLLQEIVVQTSHTWDTKRKYLRLSNSGSSMASIYRKLRSDALKGLIARNSELVTPTQAAMLNDAIKQVYDKIRDPVDR